MPRILTLILHPTDNVVLASAEQLPAFQLPQSNWEEVGAVNAAISAQFGLDVRTLREIGYYRNGDEITQLYLVEAQSAESIQQLTWLNPQQLSLREQDQALVDKWLAWRDTTDERRVPWYERGWWPTAEAWVREQIGADAVIKQKRSSQRGMTAHVTAASGSAYFKACPMMFSAEVPLNNYLHQHFLGQIPPVIASDRARRWLLSADAGSIRLHDAPLIEQYEAALTQYATMQIALMQHTRQLESLGVPRRPLALIAAECDQLLDKPEWLVNISAEQIANVREQLPGICHLFETLAEFELPLSLEHGDLWDGQILPPQHQHTLFLDWSDASITHPFFSFSFFALELGETFKAVPDVQQRLRDAYLTPFEGLVDRPMLERALDIALKIAPIHYAHLYRTRILPQMELTHEMVGMLSFYLKQLL